MRTLGVVFIVVGSVLAVGCSGSEDLECGPGTIEIEDVCRPEGEGGTVITCGEGTREVDGQCVPDGDGLECGAGTHEEDGACVADPLDGVTCGTGTHEEDGQCLPDDDGGGLTCGPGTIEQGGECVPTAAWYEMRATVSEIGADGISRIPILLIGENGDGTPATDDVVLSVGRADAGQFIQGSATLGPLGTTVFYRPCNASNQPLCAGPVELRMFLAGDLETPVAVLDIELVEPAGVYTPAACLGGGNAMFFDGDGWIYSGTLLVTDGDWDSATVTDDLVWISLEPSGQDSGLWWDFTFSAEELDVPLVPGVYEGAERWPFQSANRPGIDISGDGRGCNTISGRFQVHEYVRSGPLLESMTVTFEQYCEQSPSDYLFGCVHFEE